MKRRIIVVALLGFVAALALILLSVRKRIAESKTIIEGIEVSVLAVVPEGQTFKTLKPWHAWAKSLLPQRYQGWIPRSQTWAFPGKDDLVWILLELRTTNGASVAPIPWKGYRVVSDRGASTSWDETETTVSAASPGQTPVLVRSLNAFPRRDRAFTLIFTGQDGKELGSVRMANPVYKRYPEWTPKTLPQTVTNGGVLLTLKSVSANPIENRSTDRYKFTPPLEPEYEMKTTNDAWQTARVRGSEFLDATGNKGVNLPRQETAWKIVAKLFVDEGAVLPGAEYFTVTNQSSFATADAGQSFQAFLTLGSNFLWKTTTRDGILIRASITSQRAARTGSASGPVLNVECDQDPLASACQLLCLSKDRDGQNLGRLKLVGSEIESGGPAVYEFELDDELVQNVASLEVVLNHGKTFEFLINPADVKTNGPTQ